MVEITERDCAEAIRILPLGTHRKGWTWETVGDKDLWIKGIFRGYLGRCIVLVQEAFGSAIMASMDDGAIVYYHPDTDVFDDQTAGDIKAFRRGRAALTLYLYLGPSGLERVYGKG